uniref:uncharacterized protein alms1 isoform X2 n=1 Tax=Monopterus albus TaxID=43700 RepID=UPI0009B3964A|nr:Alstrom syndrome protein 1 isoform X2 [Monopterus albus]
MEPRERVAVSHQLSANEGVSQSGGQTSRNQLGAQSHRSASQDQRHTTDGWELRRLGEQSLQLEFQDSNLSPALSLLPASSQVEHNFTEYSLFQQNDNEFAPLRAYPDVSMASEKFHFPPQDHTIQASECGSLSQHPLAQATNLSEEGVSSCCSLSQHTLSPGNEGSGEEMAHSPLIATTASQQMPSREEAGSREKASEKLGKLVVEAAKDETLFLSKDIPAQHLLELLQKDVGMLSSSSSAVSSASETSVKSIASLVEASKSNIVCKSGTDVVKREGPSGEASLPQQQTPQLERVSNPEQSQVCNITTGSRSTQPDDGSEVLHKELLSEVERRRYCESKSKNQQCPTPPGQSLTAYPTEGKSGVAGINRGGVPWTGPFSAGVERIHREQDLWSSGNQTGIDGSYLGFLPQSQSTPGIFKVPPKSGVKAKLGQLSTVESSKSSYQSSSDIAPQPAVPGNEAHHLNQCQKEATSVEVQSLPSLNYVQKVDAWRANQSSSKTSLLDSLALQGFSGISPKKKCYDALSDTPSQQVSSLQQPPVSSGVNQSATGISSKAPPGSCSPKRGEAVGSAPSDKDNIGSAARPLASPFGRSQSYSSHSTVVRLMQNDHQKEKDTSQTQDGVHQQPSATVQPSPLVSLGQFSDVSLDRDSTLSSSQDSYKSGIKLRTSIGASSVTSLEVDNYAPYWTSKLSTPPPLPRPQELNIEERIPLYLHNLGIDQSPSTILTPFVPRGPIREPEFSPTDLCTIKGSTGTPTKSTQPSEGGSPQKGEFSRSSILSLDSSVSIPISLDSLGPAVSVPEQTRQACPSVDTQTVQSKHRLASSSQLEEDPCFSTLQPSQQQQEDSSFTSSHNDVQLEERFDPDFPLARGLRCGERNLESPLQTSCSTDQNADDSVVSSKALWEIRKLLSRAENLVSPRSSAASPAVPHLLSDDNIFLSLRKKASMPQDSSFSSSSATGDPRTHSSLLWARSSSDSVLTSEKPRQHSVGRESKASWQPGYPSIQAHVTASAADTYKGPQNVSASRSVGLSLVLSKSVRRAEPEGCSAAPSDSKVLTQPPVIQPLPAVSAKQFTSAPTDTVDVPEQEENTIPGGPVQNSSSSPILEDPDQGAMSDGSSESSLAVRVATLLQSDSSAAMVSSTTTTTDQEESKAREWIKLKTSGQQREPLELDKEDRRRIEEIKRELLLQNPIESQGSTDTESSATSAVRVLGGQGPPQSAETLTALSHVNNQLPQPLQGLSTDLSDSSMQLQNPLCPDIEVQVREIAAREGVILPRTNLQAFTSITIATRRRSFSSPSTSSASPLSHVSEPLNLTELSTGAAEHPEANWKLPPTLNMQDHGTREPASMSVLSSSLHTRNQKLNSQLISETDKRQNTVGSEPDELLPASRDLHGDVKVDGAQLFRKNELFVQDSSVSGGHRAEMATGSPTPESPGSTGHISHVHLTLSPKATNHSLAIDGHSSHAETVTVQPQKESVPLIRSSSAASSLDEGVGLSSPPEWLDTRKPKRQAGRNGTSTLFKTTVPQRRITSTQSLTPCDRFFTPDSAVPVLLPYKPHGSEELFYVPQTEPDVSSTCPSDTTLESSHTGSDDAVPPRFSSEVLGHQDPGLDRGVTIKHTEGIYSKRLKTATFKMQEPGYRDASVSADKSSQTSESQALKPSSQVSVAFTRVPLSNNQGSSKRDQGTSPVQFLSCDQPESRSKAFQPVNAEMHNDRTSHHPDQSSVPQVRRQRDQQREDPDVLQPRSLDQLWQRFCYWWSLEESCPTSNREASLLERLERLSHLVHNTRPINESEQQEGGSCDPCSTKQKLGRRRQDATREEKRQCSREDRRNLHYETRDTNRRVRGTRPGEGKPPIHRQAWTHRLQAEEASHPAEGSQASSTSSFSHSSFQSQHLWPADRDEMDTLSTMSGSMSTVDTARLIRAFGAHRVQHLKSSSSLGKLYSTINKQKEGREQRRGRNKDSPQITTLSETTGTDETISAHSSASTYTLPSPRGPSRSLATKKAVKLVSKGIQAGDLEIVSNGTRRHTRDVGTTFPSPRETSAPRQLSSSSSVERERRGQRSPSKSQGLHKGKRSPSKPYPRGISWFISADNSRSEARKENQREEESTWRLSTAWFEPYSRRHLWREPLRQVHEDRNRQPSSIHHAAPDPRIKTLSSGLARLSLQEALEMRRPEFIAQSRQRMKRLALQVEERKLQAVFTRERDELFHQHEGLGWPPKPAGTTLLRRAVPRKEMIQRSKLIYENLPEVQRRRQEERRKAEYRSYRLNAQLYNKRITGRVLGRRSVWQ